MEKVYNYIYKTTCNITGNYYVGMHSTNNLDDGYVGSGKRLALSINCHGKINHNVEILEYYNNRCDASDREREIVNEEFIKLPEVMNIVTGGEGGYNEEAVKANRIKRLGKTYEEIYSTPEVAWKMRQRAKDNYHKSVEQYNFKNIEKDKLSEIAKTGSTAQLDSGYVHTKSTIEKITESNRNKDWTDRKTPEYRKFISEQTKAGNAKVPKEKKDAQQKKALETRMIGITKKREVTKQKIYKLQQDGLTPREIRFKLNLSYHRYRNSC